MTFEAVYAGLNEAIRQGPHRQIELLKAVDEAYALLEVEELTDEQVLSLRLLLSHAEGLIGRYFGM